MERMGVAQWRHVDGVWILKEEDSSNIKQFCTISLLSVEGRIFFKIVSQCLTEFLIIFIAANSNALE